MTAAPTDRALALWQQVAARIHDLKTTLASADDAAWELRCPGEGWTVGLVACHISLALRRQARWIERVVAGRPPHDFEWDRAHALNALVARRVVRPERDATVRGLDEAVERWRRLLGSLSLADLQRPAIRSFEASDRALVRERSVEWVASALVPRHIDGHVRSIRAVLTAR